MFAPVRTVAPASLPVSLDEAKRQCRVDFADDDQLIDTLIEAATSYFDGCSGYLERALVTQTWRQDFSGFEDRLSLPLAPVASITSITYRDTASVQQTLAASVYELLVDSLGPYVAVKPNQSWPSVDESAAPVSVTFVAGYGAAASVPMPIRQAILLLVAHWYENRGLVTAGNTTQLPLTVQSLLARYQRFCS